MSRSRSLPLALKIAASAGVFYASQGCTFNIALTSQKTALENQVMGEYAELEDQLILTSTLRSEGSPDLREKHKMALANQAFNQDDIDELKSKYVIGEGQNGLLKLLEKSRGRSDDVTPADLKLSRVLIKEENRDRRIVWRHIIASNKTLRQDDLPKVQKSYSQLMREKAKAGQWFEGDNGKWQQKIEEANP